MALGELISELQEKGTSVKVHPFDSASRVVRWGESHWTAGHV